MSAMDDQFSAGQRIGIFILAEISAISASSVIILLGYIAYSTVTIRQGAKRRWRLESPVHLFLLNQLVCDLIQALGGLMNMKWVVDGNVHQGTFCTVQGLIKQLADVGTALSAGNVAIYTFSTLMFRLRGDANVSRGVFIVASIWIAIILNVAINIGINGASRFYGPTGPWCWITTEFSVQRTVADFLWMWISAFSSLFAYVALFLVLKGFIMMEGWRVRWTYGHESPFIPPYNILAYKLLAYPIIYITTVLPLAVARYNEFAKRDIPFAIVILADGFYLSSGFLNVLLYRYTRPYLLPHHSDRLNQPSVLRFKSPTNQNYLSSDTGNSHHALEGVPSLKSPDLASFEASEIVHHQDGIKPIMASRSGDHGHGHETSERMLTYETANIYDDIQV